MCAYREREGGRIGPLDFVPDLLARCINLETELGEERENLGYGLDVPYRSIHRIAWIFGRALSRGGEWVAEISDRGRFEHTPASRTPWVVHQHRICPPPPSPPRSSAGSISERAIPTFISFRGVTREYVIAFSSWPRLDGYIKATA